MSPPPPMDRALDPNKTREAIQAHQARSQSMLEQNQEARFMSNRNNPNISSIRKYGSLAPNTNELPVVRGINSREQYGNQSMEHIPNYRESDLIEPMNNHYDHH